MDEKIILQKVKSHRPSILGSEDFTKYAILIPIIQKDEELHILFEVRSEEMRRQPGEICFPGGKIDAQDKTGQDAALRETKEELGIGDEDISGVFPLDYMVSPFGMIIYAYAGFIHSGASIKPNPSEVGDTFTVPLKHFMETEPQVYSVNFHVQPEEDFPFNLIVGGEDYNWQTRQLDEYFYIYEDKVIWGLTAKILSHFINVVK
ncbi:CoA pyrophosphatase [Virgibacillus sp. C22-A2]|uniref:CoA pyrophosphatase n=1 Tax=Virgibacillus tibetensis TaxID=3042313 RepID=A0ABU6KFD6_9BACI|nr:CoA pyrophosphatase [Virgibacillus sp. C22-A2]